MDTDSKDGMITIIRYNVSCTVMIRVGATLFSELTKGFMWKGYGGMQNGGISSFQSSSPFTLTTFYLNLHAPDTTRVVFVIINFPPLFITLYYSPSADEHSQSCLIL